MKYKNRRKIIFSFWFFSLTYKVTNLQNCLALVELFLLLYVYYYLLQELLKSSVTLNIRNNCDWKLR